MTPFKTDDWERLDSKVQLLWRITGLISSLIWGGLALGACFILVSASDGAIKISPFPTAAAVFVVLLVVGQVFVSLSFENFRYKLGDQDLAITKGIFWKTWKFVSRNRVQHVDITAGPIARALGIVQVSIFVGGMPHAVAVIPGLSEANGELLRARLVHDERLEPKPAPPIPAPVEDSRPTWEPPQATPPPTIQHQPPHQGDDNV